MQMKQWNWTPRVFFWCLGVILLGWAAFHFWTGAESASMEPAPVASGQIIYENQCAPCHEATDLHLIQQPPKLDGLFRRATLPTGGPVTDQAVRDVILHGRGIMPPFQQSISKQDLDNLMEFLHTK